MWLPRSLYERLPQAWMLLGLLFVLMGAYIGFQYYLVYFYVTLGAGCAIRGAWVYNTRRRYRQHDAGVSVSDPIDSNSTTAGG